ncbi:dimethylamine corrinoid protein [Clostridium polyendosporum]|uniref:Dimethylamine corrinoid protein n=1 Tax=Clostridium polyendosporum TaxID=69208 RepID=A0A919VHD7_9CLOT|nr:corrinoid protein [Clostridium polyendosporum]GIM30152.1 dimethylamine corrinoid protein [Clostridium polyendosporum]
MASEQELYSNLSQAVVDMDEDLVIELSNQVVEEKHDAYEAIDKGLSDGMERAGQLFEEEEYFIPELLMCSDAMYAGMEVLKPNIKVDNHTEKHKVVIGVVEGDTHDIGKNLVKIMLETSGFDVVDLGRDVPPITFVEEAINNKADIIALSTLMTTTMDGMDKVIKILNELGVRDKFKVMIGGGPISQSFADKIGADGYSVNAAEAVRLARNLVGVEK